MLVPQEGKYFFLVLNDSIKNQIDKFWNTVMYKLTVR